MDETVKSKDLEFIILPCKGYIPNQYKEYFSAAHDLWHKVWAKELKFFDNINHLHSNAFTQHHFFSAIYHKRVPTSLCCYTVTDFSLSSTQNDDWFKSWPQEILKSMVSQYKKIIIPAWFTVNSKFRRTKNDHNINFGILHSELGVRKVYEIGADASFATARIERGVNQICRALGGTPLDIVPYKDKEDVELFVFSKDKISQQYKSFSFVQNYLWRRRIDPCGLVENYKHLFEETDYENDGIKKAS